MLKRQLSQSRQPPSDLPLPFYPPQLRQPLLLPLLWSVSVVLLWDSWVGELEMLLLLQQLEGYLQLLQAEQLWVQLQQRLCLLAVALMAPLSQLEPPQQ